MPAQLNFYPPSLIFDNTNPSAKGITCQLSLWNVGNTTLYFQLASPSIHGVIYSVSPASGHLKPGDQKIDIQVTRKDTQAPKPKAQAEGYLTLQWMVVAPGIKPTKTDLARQGISQMIALEPVLTGSYVAPPTWKDTSVWTPVSLTTGQAGSIRPVDLEAKHGGFASVYRCQLKVGNERSTTLVAVKELSMSEAQASGNTVNVTKRATKEHTRWALITHHNIAPLLGTFIESNICFISPWYPNGDVLGYVQTAQVTRSERNRMVAELSAALRYLHVDLRMTHGDIRHDNVLVEEVRTARGTTCRAVFIDFGLAGIISNIEAENKISTSVEDKGFAPYMAPELTFSTPPPRWPMSDVYAFVLLALEIFSGTQAFSDTVMSRRGVMLEAIRVGTHRPEAARFPTIAGGEFWQVMLQCMSLKATERLRTDVLNARFEAFEEQDIYVL